jgi:hypothetical protein
MSKPKRRPTEPLRIDLHRKRPDIEDVFSDMFGPNRVVAGVPTIEGLPNEVNTGAPNTGAPVRRAPNSEALNKGAPDEGIAENCSGVGSPRQKDIPHEHTPEAPYTSAPYIGAPDLGIPEFLLNRAPRIRECRTVQDAHTHAEQNLYTTMYRLGSPIAGTRNKRLTIGTRTLAAAVPMSYSNCHANLRSLQQKFAIEEQGRLARHNDGKTFVVYGYETILERRREAGLTHVTKVTRAVSLVSPGALAGAPALGAPVLQETRPQANVGALNPSAPTNNTGAPDSANTGAPDSANTGAPDSANTGAPVLEPLLVSKENEGTTGGKPASSVLNALTQSFGFVDDDAAIRIISESRRRVPDATDDEIAHFITGTANRLRRMTGLNNPIGMLIVQVPKCFEGESFKTYRAVEQQRREAEERQNREIAIQVLNDDESPTEMKQWAREVLGMLPE